jgi:hypothetical protein
MASPVGAPREATNTPPVPRAGGGGRAFLGRFVLAHFIAYPIAIVAAIGATPLALWFRERSILEAGPTGARWTTVTEALAKHRVTATEAAQVQIVLDFVIVMTVATFALVHLAALPWAIEAARTRARMTATMNDGVRQMRTAGFRVFVGITAATLVLVALSGMAGWAWLLMQ